MTNQINETAKRYGFRARCVPAGYFLEEARSDGTFGDSAMLVKLSGEIVPYQDDAQAFLAAKAVAAAL